MLLSLNTEAAGREGCRQSCSLRAGCAAACTPLRTAASVLPRTTLHVYAFLLGKQQRRPEEGGHLPRVFSSQHGHALLAMSLAPLLPLQPAAPFPFESKRLYSGKHPPPHRPSQFNPQGRCFVAFPEASTPGQDPLPDGAPRLTSTLPAQSGYLGSLGTSHWSLLPSTTAGRQFGHGESWDAPAEQLEMLGWDGRGWDGMGWDGRGGDGMGLPAPKHIHRCRVWAVRQPHPTQRSRTPKCEAPSPRSGRKQRKAPSPDSMPRARSPLIRLSRSLYHSSPLLPARSRRQVPPIHAPVHHP